MVYVALAEVATLAVIVAVFAALLRWQQRAYPRPFNSDLRMLVEHMMKSKGLA